MCQTCREENVLYIEKNSIYTYEEMIMRLVSFRNGKWKSDAVCKSTLIKHMEFGVCGLKSWGAVCSVSGLKFLYL